MQRTRTAHMQCPIARSLDRVGDWWSILIVRDALYGLKRFDQFQESLGIAPNMLTRRLSRLVSDGLLERRLYNERPPRYEYLLTECGRDFRPVVISLLAWGNRHFAPEGPSVVVLDTENGAAVDPVLVDRSSGEPIANPRFQVAAGPAANARVRRRYSRASAVEKNPS
jgi:DNA-binding HxlR family transcriptional regulator